MTDVTRIVKGVMHTAIDAAADRAKRLTASVADTVAGGGFGRVGNFPGAARLATEVFVRPAAPSAPGSQPHPAADPSADAYAVAADALKGVGTEVGALFRRHPLPTTLIALGAGMLLARMSREKS